MTFLSFSIQLTVRVDVTEGDNADLEWDDEVHDDGVDRIVQLLGEPQEDGNSVEARVKRSPEPMPDKPKAPAKPAGKKNSPQTFRTISEVKDELKEWMADQFRTMTEELVEAIRRGGGEGCVSKVTEQTSEGGSEMHPENRSENIRANTNGHSEEGEDVRYMDVADEDVCCELVGPDWEGRQIP
ncbi:unnamed protein product [Microthlaspi erraticum]|uniref:Uncharacterized protein n=1 Tax=Microthlaspi erraticum TaxID=1685480 RepID=A0A6D2IJB3_9BRAS|nr:unnamed protein product [Microthlaspi erraticum]